MSGTGGDASDPFFVRFYVDGDILVEVRFFQDGRRLQRAKEYLASDPFRLFGLRAPRDLLLLETHKILGWSTCLEVLGWVLDTDRPTISLAPRKCSKLRQVLADWSQPRHSATHKQIAELTGFLLHVSAAVRPGIFFMQRLLAHANMSLSLATGFSSLSERFRRLVPLGPVFHGDLEFWRLVVQGRHGCKRWGVVRTYASSGTTPAMPHFYFGNVQARFRGFCFKTGQYWRYDLSQEELARFCGSSKHLQAQDSISINALELLGMVMSAYILVVECGERPVEDRDCMMLQGDKEAAVHWVRRCQGGVRSPD